MITNIRTDNPVISFPKIIDENQFKDVFKDKVQVLLLDIDKKWWIDFKENQKIIWPDENEIEELRLNNNLRNVEEGEPETINNEADNILLTRKQSKCIEVSNQTLRYSDLEVDYIVIVKNDDDSM